jgi:hypothetical protein
MPNTGFSKHQGLGPWYGGIGAYPADIFKSLVEWVAVIRVIFSYIEIHPISDIISTFKYCSDISDNFLGIFQ